MSEGGIEAPIPESPAAEAGGDRSTAVPAASGDDRSQLDPVKSQTRSTLSGAVHDLKVSTKEASKNNWQNWQQWMSKKGSDVAGSRDLPAKYRLVTDENARAASIRALQFSVSAAAINSKMLNPNYAIMVTPGAHPDSFPDTDPFDFNSATYFIPMTTLLGIAIASLFLGGLSDRVGRKKILFVLSLVSTAGSIVKYFTRGSFWGYCIASFIFGFFLGNLPVAMAYISDVFSNQKEKEHQLGIIVGCFVMGNSGGGIIAILMEESGLFAPLWVGAALSCIAAMVIMWYLIEPGDARMVETNLITDNDDEGPTVRPERLDNRTMWNVVAGALLDNIGSTGLVPLCLSPLALEQFNLDPAEAGDPVIMSMSSYKWITVLLSLMVVPSTMMTPSVFKKIGVAATCVMGNVLTACITIALLAIGNGPATRGYYIAFVTVLYGGFPFTVFSQLTTGPMLDVLAPDDKIGYVQGLNNMAMNFGMAFAPWLLGILADQTSTDTAIWTGVAISFAAALCNTPLTCHPQMKKQDPKPPAYRRVLDGEDEDMIKLAMKGYYVDPAILFEINRQRILNKQTILIPKVTPYEEDKNSLKELAKHAKDSVKFRRDLHAKILQEIAKDEKGCRKEELCELLNFANGRIEGTEGKEEARDDLGYWIGQYFEGNGYNPHVNSLLLKQMMLNAFPTIVQDGVEYNPDNIEERTLRWRHVMNKHLAMNNESQRSRYSMINVMQQQPSAGGYFA